MKLTCTTTWSTPNITAPPLATADRPRAWHARTAIRSHTDLARRIADAHERDRPGLPRSKHMDRTNNQTGRDVVLRHDNDGSRAVNECHAAADNGRLVGIG
ncbi:DUF6973 domain-containing protein [Corynebacterium bovis]|uniref:DUF6973 domain-containing protein n=1 Tax=Corynebacterium bovis TaxID=36808 RepID=UPI003C7B6156